MPFNYVKTESKRLKDYRSVAPDHQMDKVFSLGNSLKGSKVIHVNSTAVGGGVAEILKSLVPMMSDSGVDTEWMVMEGVPEFFDVTKRLHNLLQGAEGVLTDEELNRYVDHNARVAEELKASGVAPDVWVLHDPQTLPLASFLPPESEIIWVCHIDTTLPNQQVIQQLLPLMQQPKHLVFSLPQYVVPGLENKNVHIIPPAIDPLLVKNMEPNADFVRSSLSKIGIDPDRPMVSQVARFDFWKDPWGVIDAYRMVKEELPKLQLAMLGVIEAKDDPEAFDVLNNVVEYAGSDPDIHLYSDPDIVGQPEVGAVQKGAKVIMNKSIREGFGLSVTEAMWKGTPTIGGNCGGIRIQIEDGKTGYLVDSAEQCAEGMLKLLTDEEHAKAVGEASRESVREKFLTPRLMGEYMDVINQMLTSSAPAVQEERVREIPSNVAPEFAAGD